MTVAAFVLGLAIGFLAGVGTMAMMNVAGDEDQRLELIERWMEGHDNELS